MSFKRGRRRKRLDQLPRQAGFTVGPRHVIEWCLGVAQEDFHELPSPIIPEPLRARRRVEPFLLGSKALFDVFTDQV